MPSSRPRRENTPGPARSSSEGALPQGQRIPRVHQRQRLRGRVGVHGRPALGPEDLVSAAAAEHPCVPEQRRDEFLQPLGTLLFARGAEEQPAGTQPTRGGRERPVGEVHAVVRPGPDERGVERPSPARRRDLLVAALGEHIVEHVDRQRAAECHAAMASPGGLSHVEHPARRLITHGRHVAADREQRPRVVEVGPVLLERRAQQTDPRILRVQAIGTSHGRIISASMPAWQPRDPSRPRRTQPPPSPPHGGADLKTPAYTAPGSLLGRARPARETRGIPPASGDEGLVCRPPSTPPPPISLSAGRREDASHLQRIPQPAAPGLPDPEGSP